MSSITNQAEVDRLARVFTNALFNLHSESTASTTPARLSSIIAEEPPARALPLALAKASVGFGGAFEDLLRVLVRTLKAVLAYDRVKRLQIEDPGQGMKGFVELVVIDIQTEIECGYLSGGPPFRLILEDGSLSTQNPCIGSAFFCGVALAQGFSAIGNYHRTVALKTLELGGLLNETKDDLEPRVVETNATATLIVFAIVGPKKYAGILAQDNLPSEEILGRLKGLRGRGVVFHSDVLNLLDIVVGDIELEGARGRSETEVYSILYPSQATVTV